MIPAIDRGLVGWRWQALNAQFKGRTNQRLGPMDYGCRRRYWMSKRCMGGQLGGVPGQGEEGAQRSDYDAGDEQGDRGSQPAWLSSPCLRTPSPTSGWMCTSWGCTR